jgi:hypothetical protein
MSICTDKKEDSYHCLSAALILNLSNAAGLIPSPVLSLMDVIASETGVCAPVANGAGVVVLVGGADLLCAI